MVAVPRLTRAEWASKICAHYHDSVRAILDVGHALLQAKEQLSYGDFGFMIETDLPFSWRSANHLMRIAEHPVLADSNHGSNLPNSWRTLSELAKLPEEVLLDAIDDGRITPEIRRKDIPSLLTRDPAPRKTRTSVATELADLTKAHKRGVSPSALSPFCVPFVQTSEHSKR